MNSIRWIFVIFFLFCFSQSVEHSPKTSFGTGIDWKTYEEGYGEMSKHEKPGMVVFHRSYCGACKRLGNDISQNKELIELSKQFVMIGCDGTNDPSGEAFEKDGAYFPRIYFLNPDNTINYSTVSNLYQYQYFYSSSNQLLKTMRAFLGNIENDDEL